MKKVALAEGGPEVSEFALGSMYMGSRLDDAQSSLILEGYLDMGGSFVDTANNYAHWVPGCEGTESESFLGRWFARTGRRNEVFLATKVGFDRHGKGRGLRREQIISNCEESLKRLGTDRIDLYYAHTDDRATPLEESLDAFESLRRQGKILGLGASNYVSWRYVDALALAEAHGFPRFSCLQNRFTYLIPNPADFDPHHVAIDPTFVDLALDRGFPLVAYSPLLGGFYSDIGQALPVAFDNGYNSLRLKALARVVRENGLASPSQLVLAWMRAQKAPIIPIISGSTIARVREDIAAGEIKLSEAELEILDHPAKA